MQNLYHVVGNANATTLNVVQNVTTDCVGEYIMTDYSMRLQDEENRFVLFFGRSSNTLLEITVLGYHYHGTIGLGDIVPVSSFEVAICIVSLYVGMTITAAAVGNLTIYIQKVDKKASSFQNELDQVNEYLQYRELSKPVRSKIRQFLTYTWNAAYLDPDITALLGNCQLQRKQTFYTTNP